MVFSALADPSRRRVVLQLVDGEQTVGELTEPLGFTTAGVMKHLQVLENSGLVTSEKRGRSRYCRLNPVPLKVVDGWIGEIEKFWDLKLSNLKKYMEQE